MPMPKVSSQVIQKMAQQRETMTERQIVDTELREKARERGREVASLISRTGMGIDRTKVNHCCGNIPATGVRHGKAVIFCKWCQSEVIDTTPEEAIRRWNSGEDITAPSVPEKRHDLTTIELPSMPAMQEEVF